MWNTTHDLGKVHLFVAFPVALTKYQTHATQGEKIYLGLQDRVYIIFGVTREQFKHEVSGHRCEVTGSRQLWPEGKSSNDS